MSRSNGLAPAPIPEGSGILLLYSLASLLVYFLTSKRERCSPPGRVTHVGTLLGAAASIAGTDAERGVAPR